MSFEEKFKKYIPPTTNFFSVDIRGDTTKYHYTGDFTSKIPTMKDKSLIGRHKGVLNSTLELEAEVLILHHVLSYLKFTIVESPTWWKESDSGYDLYDFNVIQKIYDEVLAFEQEWQKKIWGDPEVLQSTDKDIETTGNT